MSRSIMYGCATAVHDNGNHTRLKACVISRTHSSIALLNLHLSVTYCSLLEPLCSSYHCCGIRQQSRDSVCLPFLVARSLQEPTHPHHCESSNHNALQTVHHGMRGIEMVAKKLLRSICFVKELATLPARRDRAHCDASDDSHCLSVGLSVTFVLSLLTVRLAVMAWSL